MSHSAVVTATLLGMSCCAPDDRTPETSPGQHTAPEQRADGSEACVARDIVQHSGLDAASGGDGRVSLSGGSFSMGTSGTVFYPEDGETEVHQVHLTPFAIDRVAVSNDRFADFVDQTGFVTDAERYGWSFVFGGLLPDDFEETRGVANAPWWRQVFGASWLKPEGKHSDLVDRGDHPAIHISHDDALAFCSWDRSRLPTEAEWEFAARGGLAGASFPWGEELEPDGRHRMNVWQGEFPASNDRADGFYGPAPVDSYEPNAFDLYNMCGNVWEWCADWFAADYYVSSPEQDPQGPATGDRRVMRGGSYLCHASYCHRYRVGARSSSGPDSSAGNLGFRTVTELI